MATEGRPAFITITGRMELETVAAAARFAASLREAAGGANAHPGVDACSRLAARAFGGESDAWAPLVAAVRNFLRGLGAASPAGDLRGLRSRRELRAFVAENADLLEA